MKKILVTGGAGYIGSHTCKALNQAGFTPVTYDNLCRGRREAVQWGPFFQGDLHDTDKLSKILQDEAIDAVIHFAAFAYIQESVENPLMYFENNVEGSILLVEAMLATEVKNLVFSSTCATYGESQKATIDESHPQNPMNPYGLSKLMVERILEKYHTSDQLNFCGLRYFNAAGADADLEVGECHDPEPHLIPNLIKNALKNRPLFLNGNNYPTPDGTCIRDFIHVSDLAEAHVLVLEKLLKGKNQSHFYNLGTCQGHSLLEIANTIGHSLQKKVTIQFQDRRDGDPIQLVGNALKFQKEFHWKPKKSDLNSIIESAAKWQRHLEKV